MVVPAAHTGPVPLPRSSCPYPTLLVPTLGAMKAIQYSRFGGLEVLELVDLPDPTPEPGQIRVAVRAAGVNPIDWKLRSGMRGGDLPQTTGREVAGVVDALGEGVSGVAVGDEVFGFAAGGGGGAEIAEAHRLSETGHVRGKLVLLVS